MNRLTLTKPSKSKADQTKQGAPVKLPHELDQMPDDQAIEPQPIMRQAFNDLQRGLVDTDLHGAPGIEALFENKVKFTIKKSRHHHGSK